MGYKDAEKELAVALAPELVQELGEEWSVIEGGPAYNKVVGPNGAELILDTWGYAVPNGKVEIVPLLPRRANDVLRYNEDRVKSIKVSLNRGAKTIAREIQRRLLPAYEEQLVDVTRRIADLEAAESNHGKVVESLVKRFKGNLSYHGKDFGFGHGGREYYGNAKVWHGGDKVNLELNSLPIELAERIGDLLTEYDEGR